MAELEGLLADRGLLRDKGYIDGGWVPADNRFAVTDPATGEAVAQVARLDAAQSRAAVDAAQSAFPAGRRTCRSTAAGCCGAGSS
jgi:aspartate-semialdehyde dehydrogenase